MEIDIQMVSGFDTSIIPMVFKIWGSGASNIETNILKGLFCEMCVLTNSLSQDITHLFLMSWPLSGNIFSLIKSWVHMRFTWAKLVFDSLDMGLTWSGLVLTIHTWGSHGLN